MPPCTHEVPGPTFPPLDLAFALAFPDHAPGLGVWDVFVDATDEGTEYVTVDPPLVSGRGYHITPNGAGVLIVWDDERSRHSAPNLQAALAAICPLSPKIVAAIEAQAAASLA